MTAPIRDNQTVGANHMPGKARAGGPEQGNLTRGNGIILPTFPPCHSTRSKCWEIDLPRLPRPADLITFE